MKIKYSKYNNNKDNWGTLKKVNKLFRLLFEKNVIIYDVFTKNDFIKVNRAAKQKDM